MSPRAASSFGNVEQHAGTLTASSALQVAATVAGADTGTFTIDGGNLSAGAATIGTQGNGFFTIQGTGATSVSASRLTLGSAATLKFVLGASDGTRFVVSGNWSVNASSKLAVEGAAFEGLEGSIMLIQGGSTTGSSPPVM